VVELFIDHYSFIFNGTLLLEIVPWKILMLFFTKESNSYFY